MLKILITCKKCFKDYLGQIVEIFRSRSNICKDNVRKYDRGEHCMQKYLYEHFHLPGHTIFLEHVTATLIDKADPRDPTEKKYSWIYTLKSKGLNMEDGFLD